MYKISLLAIFLATIVLTSSLPKNYQSDKDLGIDRDTNGHLYHIRQRRGSDSEKKKLVPAWDFFDCTSYDRREYGRREYGRYSLHMAEETAIDAKKAGAQNGGIIVGKFDHEVSNKGLRYDAKVGIADIEVKSGSFGASTKFGTLGLEGGYHKDIIGGMVRPSLVEGTVQVGPGTLNMGINYDTGLIIKDGLEVKAQGIGGAITKDRIEACFILCLGFNWG